MSCPPVIDAHCHAGLGDGFRGPWDTEARLDAYLERAARAGIDRTVVFPVFNRDYAAANDRLARIVRRAPDRLTGFAAINPARDTGRTMRMIGRAVEVHGFRGIKVHGGTITRLLGPGAPASAPLVRRLASRGSTRHGAGLRRYRVWLAACFFRAAVNVVQWPEGNVSPGPPGSAESRTAITPGAGRATSTQSPLAPLWLLVRQAARDEAAAVISRLLPPGCRPG